jgi:dihydrofolate synthase / folylpolyglutamate synthase
MSSLRERLFALELFGIKLGLDNIAAILSALDRPDRAWPAIHVAGTNGKGSVTAMVDCGLRAAGYRTGRYTSPHLDRIEERIAIDGRPIAADVFDTITSDVFDVVDRLRAAGVLHATPTFFEVTTAIAFEAFRRQQVTAAVVEVGLGGRFDATNIITPVAAAITSIGFDHERHLGNTLGEIAFEKAGIIKAGVPVVVGAMPADARQVIETRAREVAAPLLDASSLVDDVHLDRGRATVSLRTPERRYADLRLALNGAHQVANAAVAVRTLETFAGRGHALPAAAIEAALTSVEWPARLEWLRTTRPADVLIDAAHNPAGAAALADYLGAAGVAPIPIVLSIMRDKDVDAIAAPLAGAASQFVATRADSPRALSAADLAARIRSRWPSIEVTPVDEPDDALACALARAPRAVVAGSIFLAGPLRARLIAAGATRVAEPA